MRLKSLSRPFCILTLALTGSWAQAEVVRVAVAANFTAAMKEIVADFERTSMHRARVSFGSTGKLYTQIINGAPFDLFLAADQKRPGLLAQDDLANRQFTYAIGKLVLWNSSESQGVGEQTLNETDFNRLAIANPKTAPYGGAAIQVIRNLGLYDRLRSKLVYGDSIAQTYQFVSTGNAELGLVALAQIALDDSGSRWLVPEQLYSPIRQDAVLLKQGRNNPAALTLLDYLQSDAAQAVIHKYGYGTE